VLEAVFSRWGSSSANFTWHGPIMALPPTRPKPGTAIVRIARSLAHPRLRSSRTTTLLPLGQRLFDARHPQVKRSYRHFPPFCAHIAHQLFRRARCTIAHPPARHLGAASVIDAHGERSQPHTFLFNKHSSRTRRFPSPPAFLHRAVCGDSLHCGSHRQYHANHNELVKYLPFMVCQTASHRLSYRLSIRIPPTFPRSATAPCGRHVLESRNQESQRRTPRQSRKPLPMSVSQPKVPLCAEGFKHNLQRMRQGGARGRRKE